MPRLPFLLLSLFSLCAPHWAQPKPPLKPVSLSSWTPQFEDEAPGARWSFRAQAREISKGEARLIFGWRDAKNHAVLQILPRQIAIWRIQHGVVSQLATVSTVPAGELVFQKVGARVRLIQNGKVLLQATIAGADGDATWEQRGGMKFDFGAIQPTENPVFRDDFMRASGPGEVEATGEWKTVGLWKTSGALGPKSDAALNPNPFVFRASGKGATASAGKWWWSDYVVSVAFKAAHLDQKQPLIAVLAAYNNRVRAEFDVAKNEARILFDGQLAAKKSVDIEADMWHRARLEPGPEWARVILDGREIFKVPARFSGGGISLGALVSGANFVDFDDVRVGKPGENPDFGEVAFDETLPSRFKTDRLLGLWANDARSWKRGSDGIWTHSGDFWGETRLSFALPRWKNGEGATISRGTQTLSLLQTPKGVAVNSSSPFSLSPGEPVVAVFGETRAWLEYKGKPVFQTRSEPKGKTPKAGMPTAGTKLRIFPTRSGVALPLPAPRSVVLEAETFEREGRAVVGVNLTAVTPEIQKSMNLPDAKGVVIDHVEDGSTAQEAGVMVGDVVRGVSGARVVDVETMRSAVGSVRPGQRVRLEVLRAQNDGSGFDWPSVRARSNRVLDYAFTTAPTDWRPTRGVWEVTERWTCSPEWSFFGGKSDVVPTLWSRFQSRGDWTLEAFLATPMDLTRGERSPLDLNVTVGGDGVNLGSGLSFLFAAQGRTSNQIRRDDKILWETPFAMPAGSGDTHQDWFTVRIEKRGKKFAWSVNGRALGTVTDERARNGQFAFWSKNGGLSVARVRLWHDGIEAAPPLAPLGIDPLAIAPLAIAPLAIAPLAIASSASQLPNFGLESRDAGRYASAKITLAATTAGQKNSKPREVASAPLWAARAVQITNPHNGGDWTVFLTREGFDPAKTPVVSFDYKLNPNVKINLYALIGGKWREVKWSGPASASEGENSFLGEIPALADGQWHRARINLRERLEAAGLGGARIESLALAAPDADYLHAGLGGNPRGAFYFLRDWKIE